MFGKLWNSHRVSVEPPPKQGCEAKAPPTPSKTEMSQWNPRRSRGASWNWMVSDGPGHSLSGTPAEAGVRVEILNSPAVRQ